MMTMMRMTMMMMMMSMRINHNNAFSDSFSASIISEFFQWRYSKPKIRTLCSTGHLLSWCKSVYDHLLWSLLQVVTVHRLEHPVIIVIIQHEHDQHHDQHHGQHNGQHHGQHYNWREHDQHHGQHELDIKIATVHRLKHPAISANHDPAILIQTQTLSWQFPSLSSLSSLSSSSSLSSRTCAPSWSLSTCSTVQWRLAAKRYHQWSVHLMIINIMLIHLVTMINMVNVRIPHLRIPH